MNYLFVYEKNCCKKNYNFGGSNTQNTPLATALNFSMYSIQIFDFVNEVKDIDDLDEK